MLRRVAFSGLSCVGKDYIFSLAEITPDSLSAPMIEFLAATLRLPKEQIKNLPGARETLKKIGQWGRGVIDQDFPVTPERVGFLLSFRDFLANRSATRKLMDLDPDSVGLDSLWLTRFDRLRGDESCYLTGIRNENEAVYLGQRGFRIYHVSCSTMDRMDRAKTPADLKEDSSEGFCYALEKIFWEGRVDDRPAFIEPVAIWNSKRPKPNQHFISVEEFLAVLKTEDIN